ncbi:MAG: hypothetical protein ACJ741_19770 [Pyrinomonadaceae bacterium]
MPASTRTSRAKFLSLLRAASGRGSAGLRAARAERGELSKARGRV